LRRAKRGLVRRLGGCVYSSSFSSRKRSYSSFVNQSTSGFDQFIGYIYWWFKDIDTAIVHTERALQVAKELRDGRQQAETTRDVENNLAFYYAEKGVNKKEALSSVERSVADLAEDHKYYVNLMHTAGYVYLKFGTTEKEMDMAIKYFRLVLDIEPESQDTLIQHQEALIRKKEFKIQCEIKKETSKKKTPSLT
jgi:hypothetical protein